MNLLFLHKHVANNTRTFWLYYYMGNKNYAMCLMVGK